MPRLAAEPRAPSLLLPYRGIRKLFHKDAVDRRRTRRRSSALTPYVVFGAMVLAAAIVPSLATDLPLRRAADAIALVGLFALARVFMSLAAMDIGTAFGTLGARREMMVGFLAEPALLMVLFIASLISATTSLPTIVETLAHRELAIYPSLAFAGVAFTMVLARRERAHPDRQSGHPPRADDDPRGDDARVLGAPPRADRVGGGAQAVQLLVHRLRAVRSLGRLRRRASGPAALLASMPLLVVKLAVGGAALALHRDVSAKMRIFRAPEFLATAFLLAVLGLLVHLLLGA